MRYSIARMLKRVHKIRYSVKRMHRVGPNPNVTNQAQAASVCSLRSSGMFNGANFTPNIFLKTQFCQGNIVSTVTVINLFLYL
jgi:hypothetical protein